MRPLVGSIKSSTGKGFSGWTLSALPVRICMTCEPDLSQIITASENLHNLGVISSLPIRICIGHDSNDHYF